jgi:hypothetical protein
MRLIRSEKMEKYESGASRCERYVGRVAGVASIASSALSTTSFKISSAALRSFSSCLGLYANHLSGREIYEASGHDIAFAPIVRACTSSIKFAMMLARTTPPSASIKSAIFAANMCSLVCDAVMNCDRVIGDVKNGNFVAKMLEIIGECAVILLEMGITGYLVGLCKYTALHGTLNLVAMRVLGLLNKNILNRNNLFLHGIARAILLKTKTPQKLLRAEMGDLERGIALTTNALPNELVPADKSA